MPRLRKHTTIDQKALRRARDAAGLPWYSFNLPLGGSVIRGQGPTVDEAFASPYAAPKRSLDDLIHMLVAETPIHTSRARGRWRISLGEQKPRRCWWRHLLHFDQETVTCFTGVRVFGTWLGVLSIGPRTCSNCGCTHRKPCARGCWWEGPELCSACAYGVVPSAGDPF